MTFRWYGSKFDTVTLEQIRQIPGNRSHHNPVRLLPRARCGREAIHALKEEVRGHSGLHISGIERQHPRRHQNRQPGP